jgi:hypothetical protein
VTVATIIPQRCLGAVVVCVVLSACGGGGSGSSTPPPPPASNLTRVSTASTLAAGCNGTAQTGTNFSNAEVEPHAVVNPSNPSNIVGGWQQDRWANGGSPGVLTAASFDGGHNWTISNAPFSRCTGGNATNGGDFDRATDPWLSTSTDAMNFTESHVSGPFDLDRAPNADGLFLGDYQALVSVGAEFRPFFVQTTAAGAGNPTDVYMTLGPAP